MTLPPPPSLLPAPTQNLMTMLVKLQKLSEEFNLAVVITNHVISDPGGGAMFVSDPKKAAGGHVMAHYVTVSTRTRICTRFYR